MTEGWKIKGFYCGEEKEVYIANTKPLWIILKTDLPKDFKINLIERVDPIKIYAKKMIPLFIQSMEAI